MIHFTRPPAGEEPHPRTPTRDQLLHDVTLAQLQAMMRSIDEALAEAQRLRARGDSSPPWRPRA